MNKLMKFFTRTEYTVAFRFCEQDLLEDQKTPFSVFPHSDRYWFADPFAYYHNGEYFIFVEAFDKQRGFASIGCAMFEDGKVTMPEIVIDNGTHMSYPDVFEHDGRIYMIPENCASGKIRLFVCEQFPNRWAEVPSEIDGAYYDTTVWHNKQGELMAFSSLATNRLYGSELFLMRLELSPQCICATDRRSVSTDEKISRQGGKVLSHENALYRVSQDCTGMDYGKALNILRITDDSFAGYSETLFRHITTSDLRTSEKIPLRQGIHTYNRAHHLDVIDYKIGVFSPDVFKDKLRFAIDVLRRK